MSKVKLKIADSKSKDNLGILFVNDEDINKIRTKTGKLANDNEYQIHYWALYIRFSMDDGSLMDIAIPTVYYNYKQKVTAASIEFNLSEVDDIGKQLEPIHNMKVNEIMNNENFKKYLENIKKVYGFVKYEFLAHHLGQIHKHPGSGYMDSDSFSGTDLDTKIDNPGICFPFGKFETKELLPSFGSIIHNTFNGAKIVHAEYRLAYQYKNTIQYEKNRCIAYAYKQNHEISNISKLLGNTETLESYTKVDNIEPEGEEILSSIRNKIFNLFKEIKYSANTEFIISKNVSEKKSRNVFYGFDYFNKKNTKTNKQKKDSKDKDIPLRNSKEWKEIVDYTREVYEIELYSYKDLQKKDQTFLNVYYEDLYAELYMQKKIATNVTILDIMQLQNELVIEIMEEMKNEVFGMSYDDEISFMKDDLIDWGADEKLISELSDKQIEKLHSDAVAKGE